MSIDHSLIYLYLQIFPFFTNFLLQYARHLLQLEVKQETKQFSQSASVTLKGEARFTSQLVCKKTCKCIVCSRRSDGGETCS